MKQEFELEQVKGNGRPVVKKAPDNDPNRPRTSSFAIEFEGLRQRMNNNAQAEKSRKTSRISKGLNPDVPRPEKNP